MAAIGKHFEITQTDISPVFFEINKPLRDLFFRQHTPTGRRAMLQTVLPGICQLTLSPPTADAE
jgi:hypothetical protein